ARLALERGRTRPPPTLVTASRPSHEAAPQAPARRDGVSFALRRARALACARREPVHLSARQHGSHGGLQARGVRQWPLRWQLELARTDLVPRQLPHHRIVAEVPSLFR